MRPLALLLLLLTVSATPALSQGCPFGAASCSGRYGAGCYDPAYAVCHDGLICASGTSLVLGDMALAVRIRPMLRATTAWCVRRLCSHVSGPMARDAMTLPELRVQQVRCDLTRGGEPLTLANVRRLSGVRRLKRSYGIALQSCQKSLN
jgi:hypothetical protein